MGQGKSATAQGGFTLIEVMVALVLLTVAMLGFTRSVISSMVASDTDREVRLATEASRGALERLAGSDFSQIFKLYNGDPDDDPIAAGSAPGPSFDVPGLSPRPGDPDGRVGQVLLPFVEQDGQWVLREDLEMPELGLPRDLSGDGLIDSLDHSTDYVILPTRVRVEWQGDGAAVVEFHTILMDL